TATADRVQVPESAAGPDRGPRDEHAAGGEEPEAARGPWLNLIYPGRTFRFCFSNEQMAAAAGQFIWDRDDLPPARDPVDRGSWNDDSYSPDLVAGFWEALRLLVTETAARQWAWVTGCVGGGGGFPPGFAGGIVPVQRAGRKASSFQMTVDSPLQRVDS